MKDQLQNAFYQEGFSIDVSKKWTSFLSKRKTRKISFQQPVVHIWNKIAAAIRNAEFDNLELEDFEHLSKKQLWQAARIAGLNAGGIFSLFYAVYFFTHLDSEKLGKLAYMVIMLNRTEYYSHIFSNVNAFLWSNMSDQEKAALSGRWMYQ